MRGSWDVNAYNAVCNGFTTNDCANKIWSRDLLLSLIVYLKLLRLLLLLLVYVCKCASNLLSNCLLPVTFVSVFCATSAGSTSCRCRHGYSSLLLRLEQRRRRWRRCVRLMLIPWTLPLSLLMMTVAVVVLLAQPLLVTVVPSAAPLRRRCQQSRFVIDVGRILIRRRLVQLFEAMETIVEIVEPTTMLRRLLERVTGGKV